MALETRRKLSGSCSLNGEGGKAKKKGRGSDRPRRPLGESLGDLRRGAGRIGLAAAVAKRRAERAVASCFFWKKISERREP